MMKEIMLLKYGSIISDKNIGEQVYSEIEELLKKENKIEINLYDIKSMATFNAKQIFGRLYLKLGSTSFYERINVKNASENIKLIIRMGILSAIEEENLPPMPA